MSKNGEDHAKYGQNLHENISKTLKKKGLKGFARRSLNEYRLFYLAYPQIWQPVAAKLKEREIVVPLERELLNLLPIGQPLAAQLQIIDNELLNAKLTPKIYWLISHLGILTPSCESKTHSNEHSQRSNARYLFQNIR